MHIQSIYLSWIVVKDLKSAVKFYTEVVGLKLLEMHEQFGWAELSGHDEGGCKLGIAQYTPSEPIAPGSNAVVTLSVPSIAKAREELQKKGVKLIGEIIEIPGHVKLQTLVDSDGNHFQLVESADQRT